MKFLKFIAIAMLLVIGLAGCGSTSTPDAEPVNPKEADLQNSPTAQPATPTHAPTFTPINIPKPTTTNTPVPTFTRTSSATPTPKPQAQINQGLTAPVNVREGPGTDYPVVGQFEPGQETEVVGRNEDSSWWQVSLVDSKTGKAFGWVFGELVTLTNPEGISVVDAPPTPVPPTPEPENVEEESENAKAEDDESDPPSDEALVEQLRCGKDFCVTYQAMVPIWENGGCVGNHSIYITVLEGPPPGKPMDGVVIGDTYNNVDVASGSHGPGRTEITLWMNSMTLVAKRHIDGTEYTSEESFNFTAHDELIPAEVLAANGYCGGQVEQCRLDQQHNGICRGHYSWRVTFHKFD